MNLILRPLYGCNLVLRDQSKPLTQPPEIAEAATMDIFAGPADDPFSNPVKLGTVLPGQTLVVDWNPDFDRNLIIMGIPTAKDGTKDIMLFRDAIRAPLTVMRENTTPVIGQSGAPVNLPGDNYSIPVGVTGYTRYARKRKVEISDDPDFPPESTLVTEYISDKELPHFIDAASVVVGSPSVRYIRISHSSGGDYGPVSDTLEVTYPNTGGSGGSSGDFDPIPRDELEVILP